MPLAEPTAEIAVLCTATKWGEAPTRPPEKSADPNLVYKKKKVITNSVDLAPDGRTLIYSMTWRYEYYVINPDKVDFAHPIPPWINLKKSDLKREYEGAGIIDTQKTTTSTLTGQGV